jgi:hypothetical protein
MRPIFAIVISVLLFSCGATVGVDYDEKTDFSQYKTFDFYPSIESGLSDLDDKRIIKITDSILQQRGFTRSEEPQFYINFFASEFLSESRSSIGIGVGGGGGNVGVGVSGGIPIGGNIVNQRLTMDFVDAAKDELIWQAVVDGEFKEKASLAQIESYYWTVLSKILKKYPPKNNNRQKE